MTENELKRCREAFQSIYTAAKLSKAGDNFVYEYLDLWEGFQAAYQLQQKRVEELEGANTLLRMMMDNAQAKLTKDKS